MVNEDKFAEIKLVPSTPKTETRIILNDWSQEVKKSPLSLAARSKVVSKSGSNYLSKNKDEYGPCSYSGCSNSEPFKFHLEVPAKNWFSGSHRFIFVNNGKEYVSFTLYNVEQARTRLGEFESGVWAVGFEGALYTGEGGNLTSQKNRLTREWLRNAIRNHENGHEVCVDRQFSRYSE